MTPKQAAAEIKDIKATQELLTARLKVASKALLEHFTKTKTNELDGVVLSVDQRRQLDAAKVKAFLAEKLDEFMRPVTRRTLYVKKDTAK